MLVIIHADDKTAHTAPATDKIKAAKACIEAVTAPIEDSTAHVEGVTTNIVPVYHTQRL